MEQLISYLTDPQFYAVLLGALAVFRAVGELFEKIGKMRTGLDWFDKTGGKILKAVEYVGKLFNYIGIGNKQRY